MNYEYDPAYYQLLTFAMNQNKIKEFIAASDKSFRPLLEILFKNTTHVTFTEFITNLTKSLNIFLKSNENITQIYIYLYGNSENVIYTDKSNFWLALYIKHYINTNFKNLTVNFTNITEYVEINSENNHILFIDDCLYTGLQFSHILETYNMFTKKAKKIILVPYISDQAYEKLKQFKNCIILKYVKILPLSHYLNDNQKKEFDEKYNMYYARFYGQPCHKYPIYFDHKIADYVSTFPEIYQGLVPNNNNKEILENIREQINENEKMKLRSTLQYVHVISLCEPINEFDISTPICPPPPYKKSYNAIKNKIIEGKMKSFKI
jgi:hypoxanthine phosphoribosyltransferase